MSNNFHESHWGQCLELLSHLCQYGEDILLVAGPSGIGKTTMLQELMQTEAQNFVFVDIDATPDMTAEELAAQIEAISDNPEKKEILLLIDDAQYLPLEVITKLLQIKQRMAAPLHVVLFATEELQQKISRSVLKEDFAEQVHTIEIEPLTVMELEAFLMHQWRNLHNNNDLQLNKSKYKKIHAASNGIPAKALQIARDIVAGKSSNSNQEHASQRLSPFTVGVTVSFGVLFCVLALIWPSADESITTTASSLQSLEAASVIAATESVEAPAEPTPEIVPVPMPDPAPLPEPVPVDPGEAPQPIPAPDATPQPELISKISDDEKIARLEQKLQALQQQLNNEQNARRASELKLQQTLKKESISKPTVTKIKTLSFTTQEAHILALPSKNFALQLLGSNSEQKVKAFIKEHHLVGQAYYYKGIHKGRAWYVVVSGNYANKFEAQQALARLPYALRKLHPWPRQYGKIHDSIKARNANG